MASPSKNVSSPLRSGRMGSRLGAIEENGGMRPDQEPAQNMSQSASSSSRGPNKFSKLFPFELPRVHHDRAPPPYSEWDGTKPGESLSAMREKRGSRKRGGWIRFVVGAIIIGLLVAIGLIVGLVVGLRHHNGGNSSSSSSSPSETAQPFPAGSYSVVTFLDTVKTDCTSNPSTWQCYPYSTINQSMTASMATFNWIIAPSSKGSSNYLISSTDNPFAITFTNASLSMTNSGLANEAYMFTISLDKTVIPTTALTSDGSASECMYNATTFSAYLYTKMAKSYPSATTNSSSSSSSFKPWPYAADVSQDIGGGASVPDCYTTSNGNVGSKITLQTESTASQCSCNWQNYGT